MQHLLPLYLILCFIPGIGALTVLSVIVSRYRRRGLLLFLLAYFCFTVSILVNLVLFYSGINISREISTGIYTLIMVSVPFSILMHTALPLAVNDATVPPGRKWMDMAFLLMGTMGLTLCWTPMMMDYSESSRSIILGPLFPYVGVIQITAVAYSVGMVLFRRSKIRHRTVRRYSFVTALIIALFLPAIGYDQFYFSGNVSIDSIPITIILTPSLYIVLSVATLIPGIRFLLHNPDSKSHPVMEEEMLRKLADRSGLSDRELSIIPLIARGLGNKQIAMELNISPRTVGNHIYNIYRKLNITSRFELLALLK